MYSIITEVLNKHAPIQTKEIKVVPSAPWFDEEYISTPVHAKTETKSREEVLKIWIASVQR